MMRLLVALFFALSCISCQTEARNMNSPRIDKLFAKTKPVCFGRFVVDVPFDATLVGGPQTFNGVIETMPSSSGSARRVFEAKAKELRSTKHAVLNGSLLQEEVSIGMDLKNTIVFFDEASATRVVSVWGWLRMAPTDFLYRGGARVKNDGVRHELDAVSYIAANLRARDPQDVPLKPGVCLDAGF